MMTLCPHFSEAMLPGVKYSRKTRFTAGKMFYLWKMRKSLVSQVHHSAAVTFNLEYTYLSVTREEKHNHSYDGEEEALKHS